MMRIDAHQHFWNYEARRHSWIGEDMKIIRQDFLPDDLKPILLENNMDGCISVQADQTEMETEFLIELSIAHPFIKGIVAWVDLQSKGVGDRLAYFSKTKIIRGFRHIVQSEPQGFMLRPDFLGGIGLLEKFNFTYDILVREFQLPEVLSLVTLFPNQKFILDHIGKPDIRFSASNIWRDSIQELGRRENVFCKLSGMVTETNFHQWTKEEFYPYLDWVLKCFGIHRLVFGSDWPVCLVSAPYSEVLSIIESYFSSFTSSEKEALWGTNAIQFYGI